jgi:hypothetical protein
MAARDGTPFAEVNLLNLSFSKPPEVNPPSHLHLHLSLP